MPADGYRQQWPEKGYQRLLSGEPIRIFAD